MIDANLAIMTIGLDPRGIPVALARVIDRVHHEGVDVGDGQVVLGQSIAQALFLFGQHPGRPGVWHVGHDLDAGISESRDAPHRFGEGEIQICVGAEGQFHGGNPGQAMVEGCNLSMRIEKWSRRSHNQAISDFRADARRAGETGGSNGLEAIGARSGHPI